MSNYFQSGLWTSSQLAWSSTFFPSMVRAAAVIADVPYTQELVEYVATNPTISEAVHMGPSESVDAAILRIMTDPTLANQFDQGIRHVVGSFPGNN